MELDDEEQWEPYESRGSSTVLRGAGAEMLRPTHSKYYCVCSWRCELSPFFQEPLQYLKRNLWRFDPNPPVKVLKRNF